MSTQESVRLVTIGYAYYMKLLDVVAQGLGMPYEIVSETHLEPSYSYNKSSEPGVIGLLQSGEVDIAPILWPSSKPSPPHTVRSYPLVVDTLTFVARKKKVTPGIFSVFQPFSSDTWLALFLSSVLIILTLYGILGRKCKLSEILRNILSSLVGQSVTLKRRGEKLLMFPWLLGMMILISCYLSVLLSALTVPRVNTIKDIEELARKVESDRCNVRSARANEMQILADSKEKSWRIIGRKFLWNYVDSHSMYFDYLMLPRNASSAYVDYRENMHLMDNFKDDYHVSDDYFLISMGSFLVRKSFCCRKKLNRVVHRIASAGIHQKLRSDQDLFFLQFMLSSNSSADYSIRPLKLSDLSGAFAILLCGHGIAFVCFALEICIKHYNEISESRDSLGDTTKEENGFAKKQRRSRNFRMKSLTRRSP